MGASLSLVPVLDYFARREFLAAGLRPNAATLPYRDGGAGATCTVHYWVPEGEPRLPPLLLVHGFGPRATWQWRFQVGPLSRHFHVIVPDLLGFGDSSYPSEAPPPPSEATQAAALAALLDVLPGLKGQRVAVAGTSYGGFVTYWLARAAGAGRVGPVVIASSDLLKTAADDRGFLKRAGEGWSSVDQVLLPAEPAAMRKLIEMASYRPPPAVMMPDFLIRDFIQKKFLKRSKSKNSTLTVLLDRTVVGCPCSSAIGLNTPAVLQAVQIVAVNTSGEVGQVAKTDDFIICQKLFTANRERMIDLLKGITVGTDKFQVTPLSQEVLIIWGDHDQLFPVEKAFAAQRSLNGNARLEIIEKTGHAPQLDDPARFNKVMLDFLLAAHKPDPSVNGSSL